MDTPRVFEGKAEIDKNVRGKDEPRHSPKTCGSGNGSGELDGKTLLEFGLALKNGRFDARLPVELRGLEGKVADTFNDVAKLVGDLTSEVERIGSVVGKRGKTEEQIDLRETNGSWGIITGSVNTLIDDLSRPMGEISRVLEAVARGDFSQTIALEIEGIPVRGEFLRVAETVNTMVDQLNNFAGEVTRVVKEVGTEGKLGGQAVVPNIAGTWKDLTDSVNIMATNLTDQVRGIVQVVTAVSQGDLEQRFTIMAKGEIASLADTINDMTKTLARFADQVIQVAKEVGTEGKLGGQAEVPSAAGTWRELVDNVNMLANNWSTQVRAIADVATAIASGDLTREITVEAKGEVDELKGNINSMITNLRDTTKQNEEQDWLKTNLAKFTVMLQGQNDLSGVAQLLMSELAPVVNVQHGVFYMMDSEDGTPFLRLLASYGYKQRKNVAMRFDIGEGLVGEAAFEKKRILLTNVPSDYIKISSGLGEGTPLNVIVLPVVFEGNVKAVIELASFNLFSETNQSFLEQLTESLGVVLNTIEANMRTEQLLKRSQSMSEKLRSQSGELRHTNEELEEKARMLEEQKREVEAKNLEVGQAKRAVEEKAEQLAVTSRYKSQFLSNMSHELRTPLNCLMLLSRHLADNHEGNLNDKQVEYASTIHESGNDLLTLLNDILDLSKIESGTVTVEVGDLILADLKDEMERTFKPSAESKSIDFSVALDSNLPPTIRTDAGRLRQVLKNLLYNSLKFTGKGGIDLNISEVSEGWSVDNEVLEKADMVVAFAVKDTGIGIAKDKQKVIFEAFQQADGTTTRNYGGTGLGLSISREIALLLGGELSLKSVPGKGSMFTFFLPNNHMNIPGEKPANPGIPEGSNPEDDNEYVEMGRPGVVSPVPLADGMVTEIHKKDGDLKGKVVLVVDDDMRNVFALTSVMERYGTVVKSADSGEAAIALLQDNGDIDAVLMDVMMPEMDGYEAMGAIRKIPKFKSLPIIALTAKAMKGDREKCISAGASDYITKPVDTDQLLSLLHSTLGVK